MGKLALLSLIIASLFVAQSVYWVIRYSGERKQLELRRRLQEVGETSREENRLLRMGRLAKSDKLNSFLGTFGSFEGLSRLLHQTDLDWTVAQVLGYGLAFSGLGAIAGLVLKSLPGTIAFFGLGASIPYLVILQARNKRSFEISKQLPEALDMLCRSVRAGHAIPTAIKLAAQELPTPIATEFGRCYEEQVLGAAVDRAIMNMTARVPNNLDLKIFAVSVTVQAQVGGNIAEIMERIAETIRERYKFYGQLRALTAEGRISGMILGALPWVVMGIIWIVQRKYLVDFFSQPLGKLMALGALCLWLLGILWMRKIAKVEV